MKKVLKSGLILTGVFSLLVLPAIVSAQSMSTGSDLQGVLINVSNVLFGLLLIVAVIFILIAAFNFITAAGDAEKVKTARNFVIYALIGVAVAVLARVLVNWIQTVV